MKVLSVEAQEFARLFFKMKNLRDVIEKLSVVSLTKEIGGNRFYLLSPAKNTITIYQDKRTKRWELTMLHEGKRVPGTIVKGLTDQQVLQRIYVYLKTGDYDHAMASFMRRRRDSHGRNHCAY
jgi:hypothetical protein